MKQVVNEKNHMQHLQPGTNRQKNQNQVDISCEFYLK